jgi:hypothetical protein
MNSELGTRNLELGTALFLLQVALVSPQAARTGEDLLPNELPGWKADKTEKFAPSDLARFLVSDAPVVEEYGFLSGERKIYRGGSRAMTVEALQMRDASAAYGAFTYFRQLSWRPEIGTGAPPEPRRFHAAVGDSEGVLLRNSYVIRIRGAAPERPHLVALAAAMPTFEDEILPGIKDFLPLAGVVRTSLKYILGPAAFARLVPELPAAAIGFDQGAEVEVAQYRLAGKPPMTMVLALYPTPQIAGARAKTLGEHSSFAIRRTGSLVSIVLGSPPKADADLLLSRVRYEVSVAWNQGIAKHHEPTLGELIINIIILSAALVGFCIVSGALFGGLRVLSRRLYPGRGFDKEAMIRLHLSD